MGSVIVLNADNTFLNFVDWKRALNLLISKKVEVLKNSDVKIRNIDGIELIVPKVIRLVKMVFAVFKNKIPFSKHNVFVRDDFTCQYCGTKLSKPTLDHIKPKSKGGKTNFYNCVAACFECNTLKGSNSLEECGLTLLSEPKRPLVIEFFIKRNKKLDIDFNIKF